MKNKFIKSAVTGLMIGLMVVPMVYAIDQTTTIPVNSAAANSIKNIINGGARVHMITIVNSGATAASTFEIWDTPNTNNAANATTGLLQYSNGPYAGIVQYVTNMQVFATNSMGLTNFQVLTIGGGTMTNNPVWASNVLFTATNVVASTTNSYRKLFFGSLAAGGTTTITNEFNCIFGLTVTNSTLSTNVYNVTYSSQL